MFEQLRNPARLAALLMVLANGAAPAVARACSGYSCNSGSFHLAKDSVIPANTPALLWLPPMDYATTTATEAVLHLTRVDGADEQEVAIQVEARSDRASRVVQLPDGLVAGGRYRLSVDTALPCRPEPLELVAGDEAPLPTQLGKIIASKPARDFIFIPTDSGSCYTTWPAVISDVDLELADEAKPWAALLQYTPRVDGKAWQPSWTFDFGDPYLPYDLTGAQTKVYAECHGTTQQNGQPLDQGASHGGGASEGPHALQITAALPGSLDLLTSDEIWVDLECSPQPPAEPPQQQSSSGLPAPSSDTQSTAPAQAGHGPIEPQAGRSSVDAGVATDDEPTVERTSVDNGASQDGGDCTVNAPGRADRGSGRWAWLSVALAALWVRLRGRTGR